MSESQTFVRFVDNALPPLPAGDYLLEARQSVDLPPEYEPPKDPYRAGKRLCVVGPHFGLDPGSVVSVYPPANSQSTFDDVLPSVRLNPRSLPWQIHIGGASDGPRVAPWCALLLLTPEEIRMPAHEGVQAGGTTGTQVVPLADYLTPHDAVGPAFSQAQVRRLLLQYPDLQVGVVDVHTAAFLAIAPGLDELPFLAHVGEFDTEDQELTRAGEDGWAATVFSNRLPVGSPSGVYVAHLVSLEGFAGMLPGGGLRPTAQDTMRLVSLASWTFNSVSGGDDFATIMSRLDAAPLTMPLPQAPLAPGPEHEVARALALGYTGVRYETRLGEVTTGWYRGPFLPVPMQRNRQPAYAAGEAALIYDWHESTGATSGLFDVSFGVAWQTGRLVALADRQFTSALLAWARRNNAIAQLLAQRISLLQSCPGLRLSADPIGLMAPDLLRESVRRLLADTVLPLLAAPDPRTSAVHPLLARPRMLLGPPRDPSRMLEALDRYPGVMSPADFLAGLPANWGLPGGAAGGTT